jgi:hypothetical protein
MLRPVLALAALSLCGWSCHPAPQQDCAPAQGSSAGSAPTTLAAIAATIPEHPPSQLDRAAASKFVALSLDCVDKPYPNKPDHVLDSDSSLRPSRDNTPSFYGCFDWHSSVHGHWAMLRVLNRFPDLAQAPAIRAAFDRHLTEANLSRELVFFQAESNKTLERPYGWGWLLRLAAELHTSPLKEARPWEAAVQPLAKHLSSRLVDYLSRLSAPIRAGTHANTAFALVHALDYAVALNDAKLGSEIKDKARTFYFKDRHCPTSYEPSGEDFLSPCLVEADLMRRVLSQSEFRSWLDTFLPPLTAPEFQPLRSPVEVRDRQDPRIGHLLGLSLQRAWGLEAIASSLADTDPRRPVYQRIANLHHHEALAQMFDSGYGGAHWLASFAIYSLSSQERL